MDMDPEQVLAHLARELRHAREARGLSRRGLAERAGLSIETIKKLEQGHGFHPRLETMVRLASGLGVALKATIWLVLPGALALWLGHAMWHWPISARLNRLLGQTAAFQALLLLVVVLA